MKKGLTSSNLPKLIFSQQLPEQYIRKIPAQALYLAIRHQGLPSSTDLIDLATPEQCRLLLDFDCWEKDSFSEDQFFEWLGLANEEDGLKHLEKLMQCMDLRLVALLISRYVDTETFDEGNDTPPGPGFYTPDKGFTWLRIHSLDETRTFYLNRLLAMIFERDAEVFYQLISIPSVSTSSLLEEESYEDRGRRLSAVGIPDSTHASELTAPLAPYRLKDLLESSTKHPLIEDVQPVEPLIYDSFIVQPLGSLLTYDISLDEFESELTLLMNAAVIRWNIPFHDCDVIRHLAEKVKGALNVGLEHCLNTTGLSVRDIYEVLGLQKLFRGGLWHLMELRKKALRVPVDMLQPDALGAEKFCLIAAARDAFPEVPLFLQPDGSFKIEDGTVPHSTKAIEHLSEVSLMMAHIEETFDN